jgi:hypothetical protein
MAIPSNTSQKHPWKFFRAGGFNQVSLTCGADLLNLDKLDQKLWVALACPTTGVEFDKTTLALIDTDKDGRVRAPELIQAAKWAGSLLKNPDDLLKGSPTLRPAAVNEATEEGKLIANFARKVLDLTDDGEITIADATAAAQTFAAKQFNGDGIVPPTPPAMMRPRRSSATSLPAWGLIPTRAANLELARPRWTDFSRKLPRIRTGGKKPKAMRLCCRLG